MPDEQIAALERQHAHLRSEFASLGEMRSGSLTERFRPCGKAGCHCAKPGDRGHGPVLSLTRKRAGKTVTRIIPAQAGPGDAGAARRVSPLPAIVEDVHRGQRCTERGASGDRQCSKKNRRPRCSPSRWRPKRHVRSSGCWGPTRRRHWATSRRPRRRCAPPSWRWRLVSLPSGSTPTTVTSTPPACPAGADTRPATAGRRAKNDPHGPGRHDPGAGLLPLRVLPNRILSA